MNKDNEDFISAIDNASRSKENQGHADQMEMHAIPANEEPHASCTIVQSTTTLTEVSAGSLPPLRQLLECKPEKYFSSKLGPFSSPDLFAVDRKKSRTNHNVSPSTSNRCFELEYSFKKDEFNEQFISNNPDGISDYPLRSVLPEITEFDLNSILHVATN